MTFSLSETFAPPRSDEGTLGVGQGLAHDGNFLLNEEAADGGQIIGHTGGGRMGAVGSAESVVDEHVRQRGQSLAQLGIVLGLALLKPGVLQQHHVAVLQRGGLGLGVLACHIGGHDDFLAQQLADALRHDLQAQLGLPFALGLAHVGAEDDLCVVVNQILDGGHGGDNPLVGGDDAVLGGNIEVAAAQDPLAGYVDVLDGLFIVVHDNSSIFSGGHSRILPKSRKLGNDS